MSELTEHPTGPIFVAESCKPMEDNSNHFLLTVRYRSPVVNPKEAELFGRFMVRAVNNHEALLEACRTAVEACPCSPKERMSGHRIGCAAPDIQAVIEKAEAGA